MCAWKGNCSCIQALFVASVALESVLGQGSSQATVGWSSSGAGRQGTKGQKQELMTGQHDGQSWEGQISLRKDEQRPRRKVVAWQEAFITFLAIVSCNLNYIEVII